MYFAGVEVEVGIASVASAMCCMAACCVCLFWRFPERRAGPLKSPAGLPIIGHIRYLNPESLIQSLQQLALDMGPAIELFLFHRRFLVLCDVASIKEVMLKRPKIFRRDKGIEVAFDVLGLTHHSLFSAEGSTWARLRKLLSSPFNKQNVSRMAAAVQAEVDAMLEGLRHAPGGISADVNVPMMQFTLRVILRVAFNNADIDDYFASNGLMVDTNTVFEFITQRTLYPFPSWTWHMWPPPIQQAVLLANDRIDAVVGRIVNNEKLKMDQAGNSLTEGRSFIQLLLLESVDGGKLSTEEVVANIKTMIFAGSETTSVTLSWALYFLSLDRQFLKKAREESDEVLANIAAHDGELPALPFCAACFKEVLRFRGPAALIGAALVGGTSFKLANGIEIRPNDTVLCTIEHLMTDPDVFPNPFQFNPTRWLTSSNTQLEKMNNVFFSFGYGSRLCPGIHLAKLEGELALAHIVRDFDLELGCEPEEVHRILRFTVRSDRIPIKFVRRIKETDI